VILDRLQVPAEALAERTGWDIKPEGACKGEVCVPLPAGTKADDGTVDVAVFAERMRMPLVHDEEQGLWALGPESGGRALTTAVAPELTLPDVDGNPFTLSSLHGQKVLLVAWASW
jgi:hypothetical protein